MRLLSLPAVSFFAAAVLTGCPGPAEPPAPSEGGSVAVEPSTNLSMETDDSQTSEEASPSVPAATSTQGRWLVTIMQEQVGFPGMIVELDPGKVAELVSVGEPMTGWKIVDSEVTDDTVVLDCTNTNGDPVKIEATLADDGAIRGSAAFGVSSLNFVELTATTDDDLTDATRDPLPAAREFAALVQENPQLAPDDVRAFAEKLGVNPLKVSIYQQLLQLDMQMNVDVPVLIQDAQELVDAAAAWGPKLEGRHAMLAVAVLTARDDTPVETLYKWSNRLAELSSEVDSAEVERAALISKAAALTRDESSDEAAVTEILAKLQEELPNQPLTYSLRSIFAERRGDTKGQLAIEAEMLALPTGGGDREKTVSLYAKVNGDEAGFEDYIFELYTKLLTPFAEETLEGVGETPVVIELFTGSGCPPCVAADVALKALEDSAPENVHIVRYHLDIPMPDPLATRTGEARFGVYDLRGTPSLVVNGRPQQMPGMAGPYQFAETGYRNLVSLVQALSNEPAIAGADIVAVRGGDVIQTTAQAVEVPPERKVNLVIALAVDSIRMTADNGILEHGKVVRALPAGPAGAAKPIEEAEDEATTEGDADKEAEEEDDADEEEESAADANEPYSFTMVTQTSVTELLENLKTNQRVPAEKLDANIEAVTNLDDLWAYAFVQDARTGEIIGASKTRVVEVEPPQDAEKSTAADAKSDQDEDAKAEPTPESADAPETSSASGADAE